MKKIFYKLRKEHTGTYNKQYTSYGISVLEDGVQTEYIPGVSDDKKSAKKLVRLCNKNDVAPVHIHDVIEDMRWEMSNAQV